MLVHVIAPLTAGNPVPTFRQGRYHCRSCAWDGCHRLGFSIVRESSVPIHLCLIQSASDYTLFSLSSSLVNDHFAVVTVHLRLFSALHRAETTVLSLLFHRISTTQCPSRKTTSLRLERLPRNFLREQHPKKSEAVQNFSRRYRPSYRTGHHLGLWLHTMSSRYACTCTAATG